jgi:hypothetical protein
MLGAPGSHTVNTLPAMTNDGGDTAWPGCIATKGGFVSFRIVARVAAAVTFVADGLAPNTAYASASGPKITAFTPISGQVGTSVTVVGTNFTGAPVIAPIACQQ